VSTEKPRKQAKTDYYQSLHELNLAFGEVVRHTERLRDMGLCRSKATKIFPSLIQELQSEINAEFLGPAPHSRNGRLESAWQSVTEVGEVSERYRASAETETQTEAQKAELASFSS
jgi:hypothetical protein